jgi:hypothetical protein
LASDFLNRWSRRKHAAAAAAQVTPAAATPLPALPALESVTFESDFAAFMHARVDEAVRRAALRKLFAAPHFNVMDGLDIYIDDYSIETPIAAEAIALLEHAKTTLLEPPAADEPSVPPGDTAA